MNYIKKYNSLQHIVVLLKSAFKDFMYLSTILNLQEMCFWQLHLILFRKKKKKIEILLLI